MQSRPHPEEEFEMRSASHHSGGVGNPSSAPPQINGQSITPPTTNSEPEMSPKISPNSPKQTQQQEQQHHSGLSHGHKLEDAQDYRGKPV